MRTAWALAGMFLLLPAAGAGTIGACLNERDPANLPAPADALAAVQAMGLDLTLAQPIGPAIELGGQDNHPCTGKIRPGAPLVINGAFICTANWVFRDELDQRYIGTAGHCIPNLGYNQLSIAGVGADIGDPVFTTGNGGVGNDFALIRIAPQYHVKVDPTMCHWGGPDHALQPGESQLVGNSALLHYGWGFVYGNSPATRARAGVLDAGGLAESYFQAEMLIAPGDSGSAVQTSFGAAAGIVTHGLLLPGPAPLGAGIGIATRLDWATERASLATGHNIRLVASDHPVDLTGLSIP